MINITAPGQNDIVFYVDAQYQYQLPFFHIKLTNVFSRQVFWINPLVLQRNRRFVKLCLTASSDPNNQNINVGLVYLFPEGSYEYELYNSPEAAPPHDSNILIETGLAEVIITEKEVELLEYISTNEELEAVVYVGISDICPDGNCPDLICGQAPQIGQIVGGGVVYDVDTNLRIFYVCALEDFTGTFSWGCEGTQITSITNDGKTNTTLINQQCFQDGIASKEVITATISGYTDWYLPSLNQFETLLTNIGTASFGNKLYWTSTQNTQETGYNNAVLRNTDFTTASVWNSAASLANLIPNPNTSLNASTGITYDYTILDSPLPSITTTCLRITRTDTGTIRYANQTIYSGPPLPSHQYFTISRYFKKDPLEAQSFTFSIETNVTGDFGGSSNSISLFRMSSSGIITTHTTNLCENLVEDVGNGWYRCSMFLRSYGAPSSSVISILYRMGDANTPSPLRILTSCPTFFTGRYNLRPFNAANYIPTLITPATQPNPYERPQCARLSPNTNPYFRAGGSKIKMATSISTTAGNSWNHSIYARVSSGLNFLKLSSSSTQDEANNFVAIVNLTDGTIPLQSASTSNLINWSEDLRNWHPRNRVDSINGTWYNLSGEFGASELMVGTAGLGRCYRDFTGLTSGQTFSLSYFVSNGSINTHSLLTMNTSETANINTQVYDSTIKTFTGATGGYMFSRTRDIGIGDTFDRVRYNLIVPPGETTMRINITPGSNPSNMVVGQSTLIFGVQLERGWDNWTYPSTTSGTTYSRSGHSIITRNVGNGWWRIIVGSTASGSTNNIGIGAQNTIWGLDQVSTTNSSVFIWGAAMGGFLTGERSMIESIDFRGQRLTGFPSSYAINGFENVNYFYPKGQYFSIRPFRQQNY